MNYNEFLKQKIVKIQNYGFETKETINDALFDYEKAAVNWGLKRGKSLLGFDTGLGKTLMQLEWAKHVTLHTGKPVLILAPLAVSNQTIREGLKLGITVNQCRKQSDVVPGINITNYEMIHHFVASEFSGIVLDESSILKSYSGKYKQMLIAMFKNTEFKLCCTATPAPNDYMELGNHSEFLNVMSRTEMLAMFFVHDGGETQKWRLKGHAEKDFWKWLSTWALMVKHPSDIGFDDTRFVLPKLNIILHTVETENKTTDTLFDMPAYGLSETRDARKNSIKERIEIVAKIANGLDESVIVWCDFNKESEMLKQSISGVVEIKGADSNEHKEKSMLGFADGSIQKIVTKPSIGGFGMNFQICSKVIFAGLNYSWESFYQAVRRCWRFGQTKQVDVHVVLSVNELSVWESLQRKQLENDEMSKNMVKHMESFMKEEIQHIQKQAIDYKEKKESGKGWEIYLGDCVEVCRSLETGSVDYSIFSPPFAELYTYSDSIRDMGNSKNYDEFFVHFDFLVKELKRVVKPGRLISIHCIDIPLMKERNGFIGLLEFPDDIKRLFKQNGFIYHSKHTIWKDPLIEATRTKSLGLMHKQIMKDSTRCRAGLPDYLITMRNAGENTIPVPHENGFEEFYGEDEPQQTGIEYSHNVWRRYASPVWMDINQSNTLQKVSAREEKDEKHICPLQLDVIARGLVLYSNPGEKILDPFTGIGSTGFQALQMERKFVGSELKESYFKQSVNNLKAAEQLKNQRSFKYENL
jgi:DNA modification methylase